MHANSCLVNSCCSAREPNENLPQVPGFILKQLHKHMDNSQDIGEALQALGTLGPHPAPRG